MSPVRQGASLLALALAAAAAVPHTAQGQIVAQHDSAARAAARTSRLPLPASRPLRFTTSEVTWASVDLSPDNSTIVFDLLGDLYSLPIAGGTATRLTDGPGWDQQPRYSPDGKRLTFVTDRNGAKNVWIANADGTGARALTRSDRTGFTSPMFSDDGQYVIATRAGQLWMYHVDGGSGVQLSGLRSEGTGTGPVPSHSGAARASDPRYLWVTVSGAVPRQLAATIHVEDAASVAEDQLERELRSNARRIGQYQVAQFDRTTGRTYVRTHEVDGAMRPVASPDGKWLVYATRVDNRGALKLRDLQSGEDRWLALDVQRDNSEGGGLADRDVYPGSAFTADSKSLITSYNGKLWRIAIPTGTATQIPFTATVDQQMGALAKFEYPVNDSTLVVTQIRGARPSPNGKQLLFTALDRVYIGDLDSVAVTATDTARRVVRNPRRLTTGAMVEHAPVWSPDGRYVAYVTWSDTVGGQIWRVQADGRRPAERLTRTAAFYDKIAYTKDGSRLMAARGSRFSRLRQFEDFGNIANGELEYVTLPAAGGEVTAVAWSGAAASQQGRNVPHVGPDSTRLYVWAGSEGLVSMRFDGSDRKVVVRVSAPPPPMGPLPPGATPPPPPTPDEVLLSPDGSRALVLANNNVYMVTVPPVVGVAPAVAVTGAGVPTTRLSRIAGDFIGWSNDGAVAHYSVGRSFFRWHVRTAEGAVRDSVQRADSIANATPVPNAPRDTTRRAAFAYAPHRFDVTITATKDKPRGTIVLRGARLVTMKDSTIIENGDLVVTDNRIAAVGPRGSVAIPDGAKVVDVSGTTIIPGYVDIHAHNWFGWGVHRDQVTQLLANLAYGVTTQRDPQTSATDILTYSDLMETGALIGPRLYSTGPGIFSADNIKSLDEAREVLRRYADHYNTQTIKQYLVGDRKVRQWVIMAARELGLTATTEGGSNLSMNLTLMQDGYPGLEHALPVYPLAEDVVKLQAASGITYTPTLVVGYGGPIGLDYWLTRYNLDNDTKLRRFTPHDELDSWKRGNYFREEQYIFKGLAAQLTKMVRAGGRVGLGSHGEVQGLGVHWELWMMQSGGLTPYETLRAATLHGAEAIGMGRDLGSLEVGKLADLQILECNPLTDIQNTNSIQYVMKNGRLYNGNSLDEVWPRAKPLPPQWWWKDAQPQ